MASHRSEHAVPECTHHRAGEAATACTQRSRLWHQKVRVQVLTPIPEPLHSFPWISGLPCKGGRIPSSQRPSPFWLPSAPSCCRQQPTQSPPIGRTLAAVPRMPTTLNCTLSREESRPLGAGLSFPFVSPLSGSHLSAVSLTQLLAAPRRTPLTEVVAADPAPPHPAPRRPRRHPGFPCPPLIRLLCILLSPAHGGHGHKGERSLLWAPQAGHCSANRVWWHVLVISPLEAETGG